MLSQPSRRPAPTEARFVPDHVSPGPTVPDHRPMDPAIIAGLRDSITSSSYGPVVLHRLAHEGFQLGGIRGHHGSRQREAAFKQGGTKGG